LGDDLVSGDVARLVRSDSLRDKESAGVGKTASAKQAALAKARQRRLALDAERDERDRRIEDAAAEVFVLLAQRAEAEQAAAAANLSIGRALRVVLSEGVGLDGAAQLVDLDAGEVRRLTRTATREATTDDASPADPPAMDRQGRRPASGPGRELAAAR
jgi:hypothetical protein